MKTMCTNSTTGTIVLQTAKLRCKMDIPKYHDTPNSRSVSMATQKSPGKLPKNLTTSISGQ